MAPAESAVQSASATVATHLTPLLLPGIFEGYKVQQVGVLYALRSWAVHVACGFYSFSEPAPLPRCGPHNASNLRRSRT